MGESSGNSGNNANICLVAPAQCQHSVQYPPARHYQYRY